MEGDLEHQMRRWTSDSTHEQLEQLIQQLYDEDEIGSNAPTWEDRESELSDKYKETSWESVERDIEEVPDSTAVTPVASTRPHLRQCDR